LITDLVKIKNILTPLDDAVDFIILAANRDPEKTNFIAGLNYFRQNISKCPPGLNIKVFKRSSMGYGLYKVWAWPINDFFFRHSSSGPMHF
jgi:hypothetical protein